MSRIMWGVLGLVAALSLSGSSAETPRAVIHFDEVAAIYVREHDGSWTSWIGGAPAIVNHRFLECYAGDTATSQPEQVGWWTVGDGEAALVAADLGGPSRARDRAAFVLRLTCSDGIPSVAVGFDQSDSMTPRVLRPSISAALHPKTIERLGVPVIGLAGQIFVETWADRGNYSGYSGTVPRSELQRGSWWTVSPDYRWAHAPDPAAFVAFLSERSSVQLVAHETPRGHSDSEWTWARGEAPLTGIDSVLARLGCAP